MKLTKMAYNCGNSGYGSSQSHSAGSNGYGSNISYLARNTGGYSSGRSDTSYHMSNLELAVEKTRIAHEAGLSKAELYHAGSYGGYLDNSRITQSYNSGISDFLNPSRPGTRFIGNVDHELKDAVERAFSLVTGREFPEDITISVLNSAELKRIHESNGGSWNDAIQGFAINRKASGQISELFIKAGNLDSVMLTIGHELGHVMSRQLASQHDEEAKAFAFSMEWMNKIKENNILNLSNCILDRPAQNGLHDVAFNFVADLVKRGMKAINVFSGLVLGKVHVKEGLS